MTRIRNQLEEPPTFGTIALALINAGYSPLPIAAGTKCPGRLINGIWRPYSGWNQYCDNLPDQATIVAWSQWAGAGLGVACGRGLIAIDIDRDELVQPILAVIPPVLVAKRGRKGLTPFYCADPEVIKSKSYRTVAPERAGLLDLLAHGKQAVLPPSIHPDTGEPYRWTTERTLLELTLWDLPVFNEKHRDAMEGVLKAFGYEPGPSERRSCTMGPPSMLDRAAAGSSDATVLFREVNGRALANLAAWVSKLNLPKGHWWGQRYRAVAPWRSSGSGRPMSRRHPNLSFDPAGIQDFGTMETFTPINIVMKAFGMSKSVALEWLAERVGVQTHDSEAAAMAERIVENAKKKKCLL